MTDCKHQKLTVNLEMTVILARLTVHVFGNDCDLSLEFESRNGKKPCNDYNERPMGHILHLRKQLNKHI